MRELSELITALCMSEEGRKALFTATEFLANHQDNRTDEIFWQHIRDTIKETA